MLEKIEHLKYKNPRINQNNSKNHLPPPYPPVTFVVDSHFSLNIHYQGKISLVIIYGQEL